MVDRRGGLAAVSAAVVVAAQDSAARQGDTTTVRRAHIAGQQDDRGLIETHMLRSHRNVLSGQHCRFAGQHEHHGACERYDRQRLVSGIQHESLHISPLIFISNGPKPAAPAPGNTKGAVLMGTTPGKRARRHVCTPHQRLERRFDLFDYAPSAFRTLVRIGPDGSMRLELNLLQNNAASACHPMHTSRYTETSVSVHPNTARADPSKAPCTVDTSLTSAL